MTRAALLASLALCLAAPVSAQDNRLQTRVFDENAVVRIDGKVKVQTTIKFGPDEVIENVAIGDSAAWQVQPNKAQSILFVKPLEPDARTNMTVVTDKRTYLFDLVASPRNSALYVLQFRYPELEKAAEEARLAAIAEAEAQAIRALEAPEEVAVAPRSQDDLRRHPVHHQRIAAHGVIDRPFFTRRIGHEDRRNRNTSRPGQKHRIAIVIGA